jgi:hypothetical protein
MDVERKDSKRTKACKAITDLLTSASQPSRSSVTQKEVSAMKLNDETEVPAVAFGTGQSLPPLTPPKSSSQAKQGIAESTAQPPPTGGSRPEFSGRSRRGSVTSTPPSYTTTRLLPMKDGFGLNTFPSPLAIVFRALVDPCFVDPPAAVLLH